LGRGIVSFRGEEGGKRKREKGGEVIVLASRRGEEPERETTPEKKGELRFSRGGGEKKSEGERTLQLLTEKGQCDSRKRK